MKPHYQILMFLFAVLAPMAVNARGYAVADSSTIKMPTTTPLFMNDMGWKRSALQMPVKSVPLLKPQPDSAFPYHLPLAGKKRQTKTIEVQSTPFHSKMPVLKGKVTSKILIAKLDSIYPYHYKMPIKKVETSND